MQQSGNEMSFAVRGTTQVQQVFEVCSQRQNAQSEPLRLLLDEQRIGTGDEPVMIRLSEVGRPGRVLYLIEGRVYEEDNCL